MIAKIAKLLLGILLVLVVVIVVAAIVFVRSPFPKTEGTLEVSGLQAPVTVVRDEWGVPQIYAASEYDLFFAQGYVTAQDRLFQMDFQRRVGMGRLSEVLGEATLDTDRFLRTLGTYRAAQEDLKVLSPETISYMQAYADGVNAFITASQDDLPLEFRILGYQPEPWEPLHSVAWGKMMAWSLGGNWETEIMRARLTDLMGGGKAAELLPFYPEAGPFIVPPEVKSYSGLRRLDFDQAMAVKRLLKTDGEGIGSNNWVVAGSRTTTGTPLLANDPHLGMQIPSVWYEVGLHGGAFDVVGVGFAGVPGVVVGQNKRIAWGVTNTGPDVQDLFIEKVNPDNPNQVEFQGAWEDLQVVEEAIKVKGRAEPVVETVRISRHGPIMNAVSGDLAESSDLVALRWTALEGGRLSDAIIGLDKAQNWEEFRAALRNFVVPSQNFVYADVDGNIGYQMPGLVPIRAQGDGTVPVPGWTGEYEWIGYIPFDELPFIYNPEVGYVATANNQVVPDDFPYLISTDWAAPYRAARIVELIESKDKLSIDDMTAIQGDVHPVPADIFTPVLDGIDLSGASPEVQEALTIMRDWDRNMDADQPAPLIFEQFYNELAQATLGDELLTAGGADLVNDYIEGFSNEHHQMLADLSTQSANAWWDDISTAAAESQTEIVAKAFVAAVERLQGLYGEDPAKWRWGNAHWTNFDHLVFASVSPLNSIFNKSIPARGSSFTVNAAGVAYPDLVMNHGASFRLVADLGNPANSRIVNTTGQSGQVFHKHYDDMVEEWQEMRYHPMRFDQTEIEKAAQDTLVLQPAGQ